MLQSPTSDTRTQPMKTQGVVSFPGDTGTAALQEWESAEIERSAMEARLSGGASLQASEDTISRYIHPPADTTFELEYAFHLLGDARNQEVLEYGCGSGENTVYLAHRGASIHAIDISPDLLAIADRRMQVNGLASGARFQVASAYHLPYADGSMDIVFGMLILHHLDLAEAAREVYRVLRKGGRAIFSEPVRNSPTLRALRKLIPYQAPGVSPFERPLTFRELDEFSAAFQRGRARSFELPWLRVLAHLPRIVRDNAMPLYRLDGALLARFPRLEYYAAIRVFELHKI